LAGSIGILWQQLQDLTATFALGRQLVIYVVTTCPQVTSVVIVGPLFGRDITVHASIKFAMLTAVPLGRLLAQDGFGKGVAKAKEVTRRHVDFLDIDRQLYPDHTKMKALVKSCEILDEVERTVGSLE
jgi:hypothetical protein